MFQAMRAVGATTLALAASAVGAQTPSTLAEGDVTLSPDVAEQAALGFGQGSFLVVPVPFNEPTFGAGLALAGGYLFQQDAESSTSFIGLGGFGTSNGSLGFGLGGNLSFSQAKWNVSFFAGEVDLNYDLFVLGQPFPVNQSGAAARAEFRYGFTPDISAGFVLRYLETEIAGRTPGVVLPVQVAFDSELALGTFGLITAWDQLDSTFYPTTGTLADLEITHTEYLEGRGDSYPKAVLNLAGFVSPWDIGVIGGKATFCRTEDAAPFYDSCTLGGTDGFRGFPVLQFYGNELASVQTEYRGRFSERFGYVAFLGAAKVTGSDLASTDGTRYAGGLGLRYRVAKDFGLDMSLDVSINDDEEELIYLYVGQAF